MIIRVSSQTYQQWKKHYEYKTEHWGQRTCYVADPYGNLIEIGSFVESVVRDKDGET